MSIEVINGREWIRQGITIHSRIIHLLTLVEVLPGPEVNHPLGAVVPRLAEAAVGETTDAGDIFPTEYDHNVPLTNVVGKTAT